MSTNSIREYTGEELSNIQLGQSGFDIIATNVTAAYSSGIEGLYKEIVDKEDHPTGVEAVYSHTGAQVAGTGVNDTTTTLEIDNGDIVATGIAAGDVIVVGTGANREIMQVTAIDASASPDALTVTRDYYGLGAAAHAVNGDIWWYKEVPGISHWTSVHNLSVFSSAPASGLWQAVMVNQRSEFVGDSSPVNKNKPNHIINPTGGQQEFDPTSNAFSCTIQDEDTVYGRFIKVMAGSPSGGKTILKLTRGFK